MAISVIESIVNMVRRELKDIETAYFNDAEIKNQLYNTTEAINIYLGTSYVLAEGDDGTYYSSPPSSNTHKYLIALLCAIDMLNSEYAGDVIGGDGGIKFKSGYSSYDSTGRSVSFRDAIRTKMEKFHRLLEKVMLGAIDDGSAIDLYSITSSTLKNVL